MQNAADFPCAHSYTLLRFGVVDDVCMKCLKIPDLIAVVLPLYNF